MYSIPQIAPSNLRRSPASFLSTRKSLAWLDELADAYPHERFTRSRSDSFSAKECNSYASTILRAKRAGEDPDGHLLTGDEVAYSPDDICGLYRPHFHASLENLEPQAGQISE